METCRERQNKRATTGSHAEEPNQNHTQNQSRRGERENKNTQSYRHEPLQIESRGFSQSFREIQWKRLKREAEEKDDAQRENKSESPKSMGSAGRSKIWPLTHMRASTSGGFKHPEKIWSFPRDVEKFGWDGNNKRHRGLPWKERKPEISRIMEHWRFKISSP